MPELQLTYEGSVKNIYQDQKPSDKLWFAYTDQYSVFDWGKMPDLIKNKGNALAIIGSYIFNQLNDCKIWQRLPDSPHLNKFNPDFLKSRFSDPVFRSELSKRGLKSHFIQLAKAIGSSGNWNEFITINKLEQISSTDNLLIQVLKATVGWPQASSLFEQNIYFYPDIDRSSPYRLIPLEVVFRFGMLEGSSLKRKLEINPAYAAALGLTEPIKINQWFARPTLEFFTKLEPNDRLLSWQEAANLSGLNSSQFHNLVEISTDIALTLHMLFAECDLDLWDGKFEFICNNQTGEILLADSIGPDELRIMYKGLSLSKELLREYYRPSQWAQSLSKAQTLALKQGNPDWQEICRNQLRQSPQSLPPDIKILVDQLYGVITNQLTGIPIFSEHPSLDEFVNRATKILNNSKKEQINA